MMYGMPVLIFVCHLCPKWCSLVLGCIQATKFCKPTSWTIQLQVIAEREAVAQAEKDLEGKKKSLEKAQKKEKQGGIC